MEANEEKVIEHSADRKLSRDVSKKEKRRDKQQGSGGTQKGKRKKENIEPPENVGASQKDKHSELDVKKVMVENQECFMRSELKLINEHV